MCRLFSLDVRGFEDRPPFFDLGLLLRGKRFGRLLLARRNVVALIGKSLLHGCISQSILHRRIESCDGLLGRSLRHPDPVPKRGVKPWDPCFINRGDIRRCGPSGLGHHRIDLEIAVAHMHEGARRLAETEVDVPSQHILVERGAAAVRHKLEAGTGLLLEVDAGDLWAADANCAYCRLARVSFSQAINSLRSFAGKVFRATIHCGVSASSDTGSKSFTTSYWS